MATAERRRPTRLSATVVAAWFVFVGVAEAAAVYRWVDRDGAVHYDDHNRSAQRLERRDLNLGTVPARADATTPPAFIAAVARDCAVARERADHYRNASVVERREATGDARRLSAAERQREVDVLDRDVARLCAPNAAEALYRAQRAERDQPQPRAIPVEQRNR